MPFFSWACLGSLASCAALELPEVPTGPGGFGSASWKGEAALVQGLVLPDISCGRGTFQLLSCIGLSRSGRWGGFLSGDTSCPSLCCEGTLTSKPRGSKSAHPHGHGPRHLGDVLVQQKIVIFCLADGRAKCPDAQGRNHLSFCTFKLTSHRHSPITFPRPFS